MLTFGTGGGLGARPLYAVEFIIQREEQTDSTTVETKAVRVTCGRDWSAYNMSQTHEGEHFVTLLRDLCDTIPQPVKKGSGRPRLPLSDMLFGIGVKVYSTMSTRRAMSDLRNAHVDGVLDKVPSCTSIFRYLEDESLTPVLKDLIERSALPLKSVETDFAVDSSGFATTTYHRWFDHKWGREVKEAQWVKAHLICGIKTNVVTAAEVGTARSADSPFLIPLVNTTAQSFKVRELSADRAYSAHKNLRAVEAVGGEPFIAFKYTSSGNTQDGLWNRMYHYYNLRRAEFLQHYHKRSNIETTFAMIKAKFGSSVRSKTPAAQVNEVLAKVLCHNIVVLIHSMYGLGIAPVFSSLVGSSAETPALAPY